MPGTHGIEACKNWDSVAKVARLQHLLERVPTLVHGCVHVEAARVNDFICHVDLHLLDVVAHQRLYAVRVPCPGLRLACQSILKSKAQFFSWKMCAQSTVLYITVRAAHGALAIVRMKVC